MKQLIECVPNFSEGRNLGIINQITEEIKKIEGVKLLDVDPGKATNRTVVTFVGEPDYVIEAAFMAIKKASELIDMSKHEGEHPRMGATDVCPLIPLSHISIEEVAQYAQKLAKRVGEELNIPTYLYGQAQEKAYRKDLSVIRSGEYEGFFDKIKLDKWYPDYGPNEMNPKAGATCIGARYFLIAYNINLNTTSTRIANRIAFDVREAGRVKRIGDPYIGEIARDENGNAIREKGMCKKVKAIGWYIEEYGIAQISANLTDISVTSIHEFFEAVEKSATQRGVRITGSELVGLIPLQAMINAGKHFLKKQGRSTGVPESEIIKIAIKSLGLDELTDFDPQKKIIEYQLKNNESKLIDLTCRELADETSRDSPAPGGGSIAAYVGSLGISLGAMVANLSANKRGWETRVEEFSMWAEKAQNIKDQLLYYVDEDTKSFNAIIDAIRLPKETEQDKKIRSEAIQNASKYAAQVPFEVMQTAFNALEILMEMAQKGNPNSITDAGVGALCIKTAVYGAYMNVRINLDGIKDENFVKDLKQKAFELNEKTKMGVQEIVNIIENSFK